MKRIPLTNGGHALVDDEDYERVVAAGNWHRHKVNENIYAYRNAWIAGSGQVTVYLHRFILRAPRGRLVDHKNGDGLDCRRSNMRLCTYSQNARNKAKAQRNSKSGIRGVSYLQNGKWRAQLRVNGKDLRLGDFDCPEPARIAREAAEIRFWSRADRTRARIAEKKGKRGK